MLLYGIPQHMISTISEATPMTPRRRPTATTTTSTAMATEQSPFFRLPRELRDAIYDLVALDANSLYYEFSFKAGEPVQKRAFISSNVDADSPPLVEEHSTSDRIRASGIWHTTPENTGCDSGLDRVCKQFTVEYKAAVERRIECLLSFRLDEVRLANCFLEWEKWVRLEFTRKENAQSAHALTIPVPIVSRPTKLYNNTLYKLHAMAYFTFRFYDSEELGPREHQFISLDEVEYSGFYRYSFPEHVLQQLNDSMNAADWKSSKNRLNERILWIQYFKRQTNAIKE